MINVCNLSKQFAKVNAVKRLSLTVHAGEVVGLLGPNGAGKTTTLRLLAGLLTPDDGDIHIAGIDARKHPRQARTQLGYVSGDTGLYDRLTGRETLRYFARLYGLNKVQTNARIDALDEQLQLGTVLDRLAGEGSSGMKQKLSIARGMLQDPPVLLLDEVTSSLDVIARRAVLDGVQRYKGSGRAILYSAHTMSEIEELCDRVIMLVAGQVIASGTLAELKTQSKQTGIEDAFFYFVEQHHQQVSV
jgi:sodium transport system ATP-binding protein